MVIPVLGPVSAPTCPQQIKVSSGLSAWLDLMLPLDSLFQISLGHQLCCSWSALTQWYQQRFPALEGLRQSRWAGSRAWTLKSQSCGFKSQFHH